MLRRGYYPPTWIPMPRFARPSVVLMPMRSLSARGPPGWNLSECSTLPVPQWEAIVTTATATSESAPALDAAEVLAALRATDSGLSAEEAATRLDSYGPNALPSGESRPWWRRYLTHIDDVLIYILLAHLHSAGGSGAESHHRRLGGLRGGRAGRGDFLLAELMKAPEQS